LLVWTQERALLRYFEISDVKKDTHFASLQQNSVLLHLSYPGWSEESDRLEKKLHSGWLVTTVFRSKISS
jgi:hypothetical protein